MSKSKFFSEAVAQANVIKETALSNAKLAMSESFAPTVKAMLSTQLNEMSEDLEENLEGEEVSLEELLNSLEEQPIQEMDEEEVVIDDEPEFGEEEVTEFEPEVGEEGLTGDEEVGAITVDDLKDIIKDVMAELNGTGDEFEEPEMEEPAMDDEVGIEDEEEIDLDEILGENDLEEMSSEYGDGANAAGAGLENLISQIKALVAKAPQAARQIQQALADAGAAAGSALRSERVELAEAKKTIAKQTKTLQEVNLLNSKLLYVNKLFKANNLTEGVKVKVVNAIDRAKTTKESENIFLALKESLSNHSKSTGKPLNENRGRASKPAGVAQRPNQQILTEDVDFVNRMKKLAGII